MRNSNLVAITILGTALASACAANPTGTQGSGGSGGGNSGTSSVGGDKGTSGSSKSGGTTGSGGTVTSGGSTAASSAPGTGGATSVGGTTAGSSIGSGGSIGTGGGLGGGGATTTVPATGGCFPLEYCPKGDTLVFGSTCPAGASCYQYPVNCSVVLCARGSTGGVIAGATGITGGTGGAGGTGGKGGATGGATGGTASTTGGTTGTAGATTSGLPALHVEGSLVKDPSGKTIVLRGSSLIDIGALYAYANNSAAGITARMDKIAAAGLQGNVVRMPVYPKIDYNGGYPYCSPLPYPVGSGPNASCTPTAPMNAADYFSKVLKPAVDYATSKNLYVIIDHHQIDNAATGTSAADATTFWTDIAPKFASYANVIYEPFNEPIDGSASWDTLKPVVQGWITTIRAGAPDNIIIVPSMSYDQHPGDAASKPPIGTNLMYTAHIYPGNWSTSFQQQVTTALKSAPVFITEWGYVLNGSDKNLGTSSTTWGTDFEALITANGASWTAWVTDNSWTPNLFSNSALTTLTDFGTVVKNWLQPR